MPRVVVIDDEKLVAEACAAVLRAAGHQVSVAEDGESGARMVAETLPDVVVSDIRMPGLTGYDVVALLKSQPATTNIPVLLISGHGHPDPSCSAAFLPKPFMITELLAAIRRLTGESSQADQLQASS